MRHASRELNFFGRCDGGLRAVAIVGLLWCLAVASARADEPAAPAKHEYDLKQDVVYGKGGEEELKLDIAIPKDLSKPAPAILFIHGGGWAAGKRQDMLPFVKAAAERGYIAATCSYRFAPKCVFPAQVEDCKCAMRYLRAHAAELNIDPERIGASGVSAGAHLSMMLGTMDSSDGMEGAGGWSDQSSKAQAVVSFVGPGNLVGEYPDPSRRILTGFLGGPPEEKQAECKQASPISYVTSGDAPMLLYFGTKDPLVPYDQAFQMATAMTDAGVPGRVEMLLGAGHGWGGAEMQRTIDDMFEFFDAKLAEKN